MRSNNFSLPNLEKLNKNLKKKYIAKVGILGSKASTQHGDSGQTNASIGAVHEFGSYSDNIPRRSFLKDPFHEKQTAIVNKVAQLIKANKLENDFTLKVFKLIGIYGESIVQEAFETGGFGKWQPLSQQTIDKKKSDSILIDTGELRRSITSTVDKI